MKHCSKESVIHSLRAPKANGSDCFADPPGCFIRVAPFYKLKRREIFRWSGSGKLDLKEEVVQL